MGGSELGRGGETSATSAVSLTWESRGREKGFLHSSSQLCLESPAPAPLPLPAQGTGKKSARTNPSCILQLDFEHLHGSSDDHLAGTRATACQHLPQQRQLLPAQGKDRESLSEEVAWNNTGAAGDKAWGTSQTLGVAGKAAKGAAEPARPDSSAQPRLGISASTT